VKIPITFGLDSIVLKQRSSAMDISSSSHWSSTTRAKSSNKDQMPPSSETSFQNNQGLSTKKLELFAPVEKFSILCGISWVGVETGLEFDFDVAL